MKLDVHGHEQRYKSWKEAIKEEGEAGITKNNSAILIQFIFDMEIGINTSRKAKKGGRSYPRLNNLRQRLAQMMRMLQNRDVSDITKISENKITEFFNDMRNGVIKTVKGEKYKSPQDYVKIFKTFWNWWIKVNRKKGKTIIDVAEDLDTSREQDPEFVYIEKEDFFKKYLPYFTKEEQLILIFVRDSLIRSPTELKSLQVKDVFEKNGETWINISDEISKIIGRQLNLIYCGKELLSYIAEKEKKPDDYLFEFSHLMLHKKMKKVSEQVWKNAISHPKAKGQFKDITLYDLRHSGAIDLRMKIHENPAALSLDTLRERGGWKDLRMIDYYTKFIGLSGEIRRDKLQLEVDKTRLEDEIEKLKLANEKRKKVDAFFTLLLEDEKLQESFLSTILEKGAGKKLMDAVSPSTSDEI